MKIMFKLGLFTLVLAVLLVPALIQPKPVLAEAVTQNTHEELPFSTVFENTCAGEPIALEGTIHLVTTTTVDSRESCFGIAGGDHFRVSSRFEGQAVGLTTGTIYQIKGAEHETIQRLGNETANGRECDTYPLIFSNAGTLNLISQGSTPNLLVHITLHTTFDSRGRVTSDTGNAFVECRGRQ